MALSCTVRRERQGQRRRPQTVVALHCRWYASMGLWISASRRTLGNLSSGRQQQNILWNRAVGRGFILFMSAQE
ncbi:hypothetical protein TYRP_004133 [Tyrophagus putrescentiae]|nr:hypothetical protein TYRP_004133 [Tyrophagus putrescentiae]